MKRRDDYEEPEWQKRQREETEAFEAGLNKAYDILWAMFRSSADGKSCDFNTDYEEKLQRIIRLIDFELGR